LSKKSDNDDLELLENENYTNYIAVIAHDPWMEADYGFEVNEFIKKLISTKQTSQPLLPKGKVGKRPAFSNEVMKKALIDFYTVIQYQGKTLVEFLDERFKEKYVSISLWYDWKNKYENGQLDK
jgi:hypothetical protein